MEKDCILAAGESGTEASESSRAPEPAGPACSRIVRVKSLLVGAPARRVLRSLRKIFLPSVNRQLVLFALPGAPSCWSPLAFPGWSRSFVFVPLPVRDVTSSLRPEPWFPDPAAPLGSRTPHTPIHPAADSASASVCSRREVPFPRQVGVSTTEGAGCGAWSGGAREGMTALLPPGWAWALGAESLGTLRLSAPPLPPRPGPAPAGSRRPSTPALAAHLASRSLRRPTDPPRRPRGPSAPHVSHPLTPLVPTQTGRPASLSESLILSRVYGD